MITVSLSTSSSANAERPRCRVGQFWPKVEDDILHTMRKMLYSIGIRHSEGTIRLVQFYIAISVIAELLCMYRVTL